MILAHDHNGLVTPLGVRKRDRDGRPQIPYTERVERVPVAPNGNLVLHVVGLPVVMELPKALEALDVASHLDVRFGADVVLSGHLGSIHSVSRCGDKGGNACHQQGLQSSL
jgi:hypothetical protein